MVSMAEQRECDERGTTGVMTGHPSQALYRGVLGNPRATNAAAFQAICLAKAD